MTSSFFWDEYGLKEGTSRFNIEEVTKNDERINDSIEFGTR